MSKQKRLLFIEDLCDFYLNKYKQSIHFSANESGYQLFVQVPAEFEVNKKTDYEDDSLLFCKVKLMHSGENRNHSNVTDEALEKASKTLAYKPVLANFMEYKDEETGEILKDFTSHDIELNDDGSVNYIEKQIGCFTSDEPFFEIEEETGHNFLYGYCAIPKEYTDAASIIERKDGTKISVELAVNEMSFNANTKVLELTDVIIMGATCLGKNPDTLEDVGEGMLNARLDIADFNAKNNSLFSDYNSTLVGLQKRLEKLETACFNYKNDNNRKEEVIEVDNGKFEGEITEIEEVTEAEETTEEDVAVSEEESEEVTVESSEEETEDVDLEEETTIVENQLENTVEYSFTVNGEVKKFAVSLQEKIYAIQDLVNATYAEADNTYYGVTVYDDYVIMQDWWNGKYFKQTYEEKNESVFTLTGDRVEVFVEFVTADEQKELDTMRANYADLKEFKENVEKNELHAQREEIINSEKYSVLAKTDEDGNFVNVDFAKLVSEVDNYSLADLETKIKVMHSDYISSHATTFAAKEVKPKQKVLYMANSNSEKESKKKAPYGGIFEKYNK